MSNHMTKKQIKRHKMMNEVLTRLYAINNGWDGITTAHKNVEAERTGLLRNSINNSIRRAKATGWVPESEVAKSEPRLPECIAWMPIAV